MSKFVASLFFWILAIYPISAFSMEEEEDIIIEGRTLVTSANSTRLFYQAAYTAYTNVRRITPINPLLAAMGFDPLEQSYRTNILKHGDHAGIPEKEWTIRGSSKATNQSLLKEICNVYLDSYTWEPGALTVNNYPGNEIENPYIEYTPAYMPHRPDEMTDLERACLESLQ